MKPLSAEDKEYRFWAWCRCGDSLENCGVEDTQASDEIKSRHPKVAWADRGMWFFCFGCDQFYKLKKVKE